MAYEYEGAALARRLAFLALLTLGAIALAVYLSWLVIGLVADDGDDAGSATSATSVPSTSAPQPTTTTTTTTTITTTTTTTVPVSARVLSSLLGEMSLERKVAQLVLVGGPGPDLSVDVEEKAGSPCVGGLFVARNAGNWAPPDDPGAAQAGIAAIAAGAAECAIRPLIATDAEAGNQVLRVPVPPLPRPRDMVASHGIDPVQAAAEAEVLAARFATELASLGVHVNFGVVADVDVDASYYMARQGRTFGADPATVADLTAALVSGHCAGGVAATLKHFPNQGATADDPHLGDSVSSATPQDWERSGRIPYVETAAPLVMTGHVRYDGVDGATPASLSVEITTGWLRAGLGYDGVVVTDDLQAMRGVIGAGSTAAGRAVAAVAAGADLVLFVSPAEIDTIVDALAARAVADREFSARIDESVGRILELKAGFGLVDGLEPEWFPLCGD